MSADPNTVHIFISFSQKDRDLKDEMAKHLKILKRQRLIDSWFERDMIPAGEEPAEVVKTNLSKADIILLLVSSDYIAEDNIWDEEVEAALARHENKADPARVVPVILRPCNWQQMPFGKLMAAPQNGTPVMSHPQTDVAFTFITTVIKTLAEKIKQFKKENPHSLEQNSPTGQHQSADARQLELEALNKLEIDLVSMLNEWRAKIASMADGTQKFYLKKEIQEKEKELATLRQKQDSLKKMT